MTNAESQKNRSPLIHQPPAYHRVDAWRRSWDAISNAVRPRSSARMMATSRVLAVCTAVVLLALVAASVAGAEPAPLVLEKTIPLPDVGGRIDHLAIDLKRQRLIVAALGNDTVEIIDLTAATPTLRIRGLAAPQGVAYADQADVVFAANAGDGSLRMFRGDNLAPLDRIDLHDDADNIRLDPRRGEVVTGYGAGGLAIIDPVRRALIGTVTLQAHPEGFQIDPATGHAFVNVPDAHQIAVVDLDARRQIAAWKVPGASGNFPMALDPARGVLAVVFRRPPALVLLDTATGAVMARLPVGGDADDVFFDTKRQRIYVSCGAGELAVYQRDGANYRPLPSIPTKSGARTSLFVPQLDRLFVAVRAGLPGSAASIQVFRPTP